MLPSTPTLTTLHRQWQLLWEPGKTNFPIAASRLFIRTGMLLLVYMLFDRLLIRVSRLPIESYHEPVIFTEFIRHIFKGWHPVVLLPVVPLLIVPSFRRRLISSWIVFKQGKHMRLFTLMAAVVLAWDFATYDYNLFFDQSHCADRVLLLLLVPLIYWRPVFLLPFIGVLLSVIWQFTSLSGFSMAAPDLLIRLMILFAAFFMVYVFTERHKTSDFVFLAGCLFATHYWVSGSGKVSHEWIFHDQIYYLLPATYANGWLAFLNAENISSITQTLSAFNIPMKIFTLVVETGAVFFFLNRTTVRFFLGTWMLFHLGIFLTSGICFWMWMAMDATLLLLFLRKKAFSTLPIFDKPHLLVSVLLITTGAYWCRPVKLAWFDTPLTYTYRLEAKTESGRTVQLPPNFFAPYDYQFTLCYFTYLTSRPSMGIAWGSTGDADLVKWLRESRTDEAVFNFEKSNGSVQFDESKRIAFDTFIKTFVKNWNKRLSKDTGLSWMQAPRLLWTFPKRPAFEKPEPIRHVTVVQVTSYYRTGQYAEIRSVPVYETDILSKQY